MYRSYASCNHSPRSTTQLDNAYGPGRRPSWSTGRDTTSSNAQNQRKPIQSGLSIVSRALRVPRSSLEDLEGIGNPLELIQDFFDRQEDLELDYDIDSITWRRRLLKTAIKHENTKDVLYYFRTLVTRNIGGVGNPHAEAPDIHDRKHTFNRYKHTIRQTTGYINRAFDASKDKDERGHIYECVCDTIIEFGKSATLLSGGGTLGMYHIGILKAFRGTNPRLISPIISGASAGSIVASVFASKKDEDLDEAVQQLCHGDLDVFVNADETSQGFIERFSSAWARRALYDPKNLERVMKDLLGEKLTFKDAYNLTGKTLNITVSTSEGDKDDFSLLNHVTSPDIVVWSAVVASCAVPFAFPAGQLYFRDTDMNLKKVDTPVGHMDGSIYGDVPMDRMSREFNVNYFVVSQVNPHVVPFLNTNKTLQRWFPYTYYASGKDFMRGAILNVLDPLQELNLPGGQLIRGVRSVFHQRYEGDLTLLPVRLGRNLGDVLNCMSNPTHEFMDRAVENGEKEAERMLAKAHVVLDVEMMLQDLKVQLKTKLKFSKSEEDLHRKAIEDRMQSGRSYHALSRRGGAQHSSTKSVVLPSSYRIPAKAHRTSQSLELGYLQRNISAEKVAGSAYSSNDEDVSSTSDCESEHSGDESPTGLRIAMPTTNLKRFSSNPPSPIDTRRWSYFPPSRSSSRSSSPGDPVYGRLNLRMTPRTPSTRSASPEQSRKGPARKETKKVQGAYVSEAFRPRVPKSLKRLVDWQSGLTGPMSFRIGKGFRRKRSLSAAGIDEWVRETGGPERKQEG